MNISILDPSENVTENSKEIKKEEIELQTQVRTFFYQQKSI